jgi:hypothetical protein
MTHQSPIQLRPLNPAPELAPASPALRNGDTERQARGRESAVKQARRWAERARRAETALNRVRAALDDLCDEPHPSHDHVCPDDVRRHVLAALDEPAPPAEPPVHVGDRANAEDCPACRAADVPPPYPWICPGPQPAAAHAPQEQP